MDTAHLQVAVIGAGRMGADHVDRLVNTTTGASACAVVDPDAQRAERAAVLAGGVPTFETLEQLLASNCADAVILASPGHLHEEALITLIDNDVPVLCEKPLTTDPESALRVVRAEQAQGKALVQVGFMRRFDRDYQHLRQLVESDEYGRLLMLHHQHRNQGTPPGFTDSMIIHDSAVHEFDAIRFLSGEEIANVHVRLGRTSRYSAKGLHDPLHITVQTTSGLLASIEVFVSAQLGYQVHTQATFELGVATIGESTGVRVATAGKHSTIVEPDFLPRFRDAYNLEVQAWVNAVKNNQIAGPSTWDGYAAAVVCETATRSLSTKETETVHLAAQ